MLPACLCRLELSGGVQATCHLILVPLSVSCLPLRTLSLLLRLPLLFANALD